MILTVLFSFLAGEIIIVETPYSSILLPEYYNTHCQTCYCRVIAPIPCWCCAKVSLDCQHVMIRKAMS